MSTLEKAFKVYSDTIRRIFNPNWIKLFYSFQQNLYKKINLSYFLNHNIYYESNPWISNLNLGSLQEEKISFSPERAWEQVEGQKPPSFRIRITRGISQISQNLRRFITRSEKPSISLPEIKPEETKLNEKKMISLNKYIEGVSTPLIQASPFKFSEPEKKYPENLSKPKIIQLIKPSQQVIEEEIKRDKLTQIELIEPVTIPLTQGVEEKIQLKESINIMPESTYNNLKSPKKMLETIIVMNTLLGSQIRNISSISKNYFENITEESGLSPEQLMGIKQDYNYNAMNIAKLSPAAIIQGSEGLLLRSEIARQRLINIPRTVQSEEKLLELSSKIMKEKIVSGKVALLREEEIKSEIIQEKIREKPSIIQGKTGEVIDLIEEKKILEDVLQPTLILKSLAEEMKSVQLNEPKNIARINSMEVLRRLNSFVYREEGKVTPVIRRMSQASNIKNTLLGFRLLEKLASKTYSERKMAPIANLNMSNVANISNDYLTKQLISTIASWSMLSHITTKIEEEMPYEQKLPFANIRIPD
ncbi:hypothetical protein FJY84_06140, partial [Candidatus Bathyarchaeota archaeon]|nr:hypothetical protein [Candidatus Bathyarchaeota archaeon]